MSWTLARLIERARPAERTWLLLRVVTMDDATAMVAWRRWLAARGESPPDPAELRLLPSTAQRLNQLRISSGLPDEIAAARRNTFVANQARLAAARPLLERLCAEMPVMLLKGGARIAADPTAAHLRVIRDIDLLFKPEHLPRALELSVAAGYRSVSGLLPGPVKSRPLAPLFVAGKGKPDYLELDIHAVPLRFGRTGYHDADLWRRAIDADLVGLPVKIPSASDRFLHSIAHGLVADDARPADWILDASSALRDHAFDVRAVVLEILQRRLGLPLAVAGALLNDLGIAVPDAIATACNRDLSSPLFRRELAATMKSTRSRTLVDRAALVGAEWRRSRGRRTHIRSWKTSWMAVPSLRRPGTDWTNFVTGRAELSVNGIDDSRLTVRFSGIPRHLERPSFDILLEGLWIGRVRFRWTHRFALRPPPSWTVRMTFRYPAVRTLPGQARLTVVALDKQKAPTTTTPDEMRVVAEAARG